MVVGTAEGSHLNLQGRGREGRREEEREKVHTENEAKKSNM